MDLDGVSVLVLGVSLGVVVLLLANTHRFQRKLDKDARQLEGILSSLEQQALSLRSDVQRLQRNLDAKTDHQYLDKRIDGLVQLIKHH
ncbi:MAG: hypothetical protein Q8P02_00190 [Candidatus Micrarchaeota archaeon]|nr:hypothetical protein [Candidatus Micrarchaeota archaeon]